MKSDQVDIDIVGFIEKLQTFFVLSTEDIESIADRAKDLGIFNESKSYRSWMEDLKIKNDSICPKCFLPRHLGQCLNKEINHV